MNSAGDIFPRIFFVQPNFVADRVAAQQPRHTNEDFSPAQVFGARQSVSSAD